MENRASGRVDVYARRNEGSDRLGTRLWRLEAGQSRSIGLSGNGQSHILTFTFDGESETGSPGTARLRVEVNTTRAAGGRTLHIVVQSEDELEVEDSSSGRMTIRREGSADVADADLDSDEDDDLLNNWVRPSPEEAAAACKKHIELHVAEITKVDLQWEAELERWVKAHTREGGTVASLLEQAAVQAGPLAADAAVLRQFRLRHKRDTNPVFEARAYDDDVRTIREAPSSDANKLGTELREVIQVAEERELVASDGRAERWLRCTPRPGDPSQCWLKAAGGSTVWELAPRIETAQASTSFFLASGLKVLQIALAQSSECSDALLECAGGFAEQLEPLSLFETGGPAVDQALQALLDWLAQQAKQSKASDRAVLILCQLVSARGTLTAIVSLWRFFREHPERLSEPVLQVIDGMFEPSGFEPSARELFCEPPPGTMDQLLGWWRKEIIPHVRGAAPDPAAAVEGEAQPEVDEITRKIEQSLMAGDIDQAVAEVRAKVPRDAYATMRLRPLLDFSNADDARLYRSAFEALEQLRHRLGAAAETEPDEILTFFILQISILSMRLRPLEARCGDQVSSMPVCIDSSTIVMQEWVSILEGQHEKLVGPPSNSDERASSLVVLCTLHLLQLNLEAMNAARMLLPESESPALHAVLTRYLDIDVKLFPHCKEICEACADVYAVSQDNFLRTPTAKSVTAQGLVSQYISTPTSGSDDVEPDSTQSAQEPFDVEPNVLSPLQMSRTSSRIHATPQGYVQAKSGPKAIDPPEATQLLLGLASSTVMSGAGKFFLSARVDAKTAAASPDNPQGIQGLMLGLLRPDADVEGMSDLKTREGSPPPTERWFYHPLTGALDCATAEGEAEYTVSEDWLRDSADFWRTSDAASTFDCMGLLLDLDAGALFAVLNGRMLGPLLTGLKGDFCWAVAVSDNLGVALSATSISETHSGDVKHSAGSIIAELALEQRAAVPLALNASEEGSVIGHLAASVLESLCQRDVLALRTIMHTPNGPDAPSSTQSAAFTNCVLSLWRHCAMQSTDTSSELAVETTEEAVDEDWGWERAHDTFRRRSDNQVATRERGTRPDYAGVLGPLMESGIYEVSVVLPPSQFSIYSENESNRRRCVHMQWKLELSNNGAGTWIGVASEKLPLGSENPPFSFSADQHGLVWWWYCRGETGSNDGSGRGPSRPSLRYDVHRPVRLRLDCQRHILEIFCPADSTKPNHTFKNVVCADGLRPFSYHE